MFFGSLNSFFLSYFAVLFFFVDIKKHYCHVIKLPASRTSKLTNQIRHSNCTLRQPATDSRDLRHGVTWRSRVAAANGRRGAQARKPGNGHELARLPAPERLGRHSGGPQRPGHVSGQPQTDRQQLQRLPQHGLDLLNFPLFCFVWILRWF